MLSQYMVAIHLCLEIIIPTTSHLNHKVIDDKLQAAKSRAMHRVSRLSPPQVLGNAGTHDEWVAISIGTAVQCVMINGGSERVGIIALKPELSSENNVLWRQRPLVANTVGHSVFSYKQR